MLMEQAEDAYFPQFGTKIYGNVLRAYLGIFLQSTDTVTDMIVSIAVSIGIAMEGRKDILGVWISEHESIKFGLSVLNDLKRRGVLDVYLFCTDGLCGMMQAIEAVYPKSRLQRCIVHQIRSSTRYVSYKDIKQVVADFLS